MKARTKGQRKRAKAGRPRHEHVVYREPNGRASRSAHPADSVALSARAKHMNLTLKQAKDQKAATYLGQLALLGARDGISERQYQAAQAFRNLYEDYQKAVQSPGAYYDDRSGAPSDFVSDDYINHVETVKEVYDEARKAIQQAQGENRHENLWAALDYIILREQAFPHMLGATRLVCNALARFFRC